MQLNAIDLAIPPYRGPVKQPQERTYELPVEKPQPALKLSAPCQVKKGSTWLEDPAKVILVRRDGTFDVAVFEYQQVFAGPSRLEKAYELKSKPYPDEVREPTAAITAAMCAYEEAVTAAQEKPQVPDLFTATYFVDVVRSDAAAGVVRAKVRIAGQDWVAESHNAFDEASTCEQVLCAGNPLHFHRRHYGAAERNYEQLKQWIREQTGWNGVDRIYTRGFELKEIHDTRVHSQAREGLAIVVLAKGEVYDRAKWAAYAEPGGVVGSSGCRIL